MDKLLIAQKLESLRRCIERVDSKCPPSADALGNDIDAQDIVVLKDFKTLARQVAAYSGL